MVFTCWVGRTPPLFFNLGFTQISSTWGWWSKKYEDGRPLTGSITTYTLARAWSNKGEVRRARPNDDDAGKTTTRTTRCGGWIWLLIGIQRLKFLRRKLYSVSRRWIWNWPQTLEWIISLKWSWNDISPLWFSFLVILDNLKQKMNDLISRRFQFIYI